MHSENHVAAERQEMQREIQEAFAVALGHFKSGNLEAGYMAVLTVERKYKSGFTEPDEETAKNYKEALGKALLAKFFRMYLQQRFPKANPSMCEEVSVRLVKRLNLA